MEETSSRELTGTNSRSPDTTGEPVSTATGWVSTGSLCQICWPVSAS